MKLRRVWIASAIAVLIAGSSAAITASAHASPNNAVPGPVPTATATVAPLVHLSCERPSVSALGFAPALTLTQQVTTFDRTHAYRKCSAIGQPSIFEGYEHRTGTLFDDCTMLLQPGNANYTVVWNTNQTSTFALSRSVTLSGSTLTYTFTGTVTAGLFAGLKVKQVSTANATELLDCLNNNHPLPFLIFDIQLTIHS